MYIFFGWKIGILEKYFHLLSLSLHLLTFQDPSWKYVFVGYHKGMRLNGIKPNKGFEGFIKKYKRVLYREYERRV